MPDESSREHFQHPEIHKSSLVISQSNKSFSRTIENYAPRGSASKRESRRTANLLSEREKESEHNAELLRYEIDDFDNELNELFMQLDGNGAHDGEPIIEDYPIEYNGLVS